MVLRGSKSDSSFYHLAKIKNNEFWAGGKYGILRRIDTLGNVSSIPFPNEGHDILKIERVKNHVFILTSNSVVFKYNIEKETFIKKDFKGYTNKCFYDLVALSDGQIMVCGGHSDISKGEKRIPNGFISIIDNDLREIKTVWKSYRKFVWSLSIHEHGEVLASTFNGVNTKIIKSKDFKNWDLDSKVKGLVHEIKSINGKIWYSGTKNIKFKETGIFGFVGGSQNLTEKTGCLWSMEELNGKIVTVSSNGKILIFNKENLKSEELALPKSFSMYDIEKISETKVMVVGHGKSAFIIDLNKEANI